MSNGYNLKSNYSASAGTGNRFSILFFHNFNDLKFEPDSIYHDSNPGNSQQQLSRK